MVGISSNIAVNNLQIRDIERASNKLIITFKDDSIFIKSCKTRKEVNEIYDRLLRDIQCSKTVYYQLCKMGISTVVARYLANHLGLQELSQLSSVSVSDIYNVRGIGEKRCKDTIKILHNNGYRLIDEQNWGYENL